jgi:chromosome segregation ATPase
MIADDVAKNLGPYVAQEPAPVVPDELQVAFTTLRQVHDTIIDLKARCLSVAEIEDINRMIHALETRLGRYQSECARLSESLKEAERRSDVYERRSKDADAQLASLQRTISQLLTEPNKRILSGKA